jgi:hypothetical protein
MRTPHSKRQNKKKNVTVIGLFCTDIDLSEFENFLIEVRNDDQNAFILFCDAFIFIVFSINDLNIMKK